MIATTRTVRLERLGRIGYADGLERQRRLVKARQAGGIGDRLLLLEHDPVFTLGRRGDLGHIRIDESERKRRGIDLYHTDRGGDVTWHGPGQLVGYPVISLAPDRKDIVRYVRDLEEVLIRTAGDFGVRAARVKGLTGVWVGDEKLAAIGVRIARWVTSHGFALNVCNSLDPFDLIVPCGIADKGVTTLSRAAGREIAVGEAADRAASRFAEVFDLEIEEGDTDEKR